MAGMSETENMNETVNPAPVDESGPEAAGDPAELAGKLAEQTARAEEYLNMLQRTQADFENFRRRTRQEKEEAQKYCSWRLVTNLLPVLDNFERAMAAGGDDIQSFRSGMEMIFRQLKDVLEKEGVQAMQAVGEEFDPTKHEAVMSVQSAEHPNNTVVEDVQKGYLLLDRVIRPAMVKVATNG
jgi:molecular chaperone GrpE